MNKCFRKLAVSPSSDEMVRRHWVGPTESATVRLAWWRTSRNQVILTVICHRPNHL